MKIQWPLIALKLAFLWFFLFTCITWSIVTALEIAKNGGMNAVETLTSYATKAPSPMER